MGVFDHKDYKKFLAEALEAPGLGRGARSRLAEAMGCQLSFLSQVLRGPVHLTLDHGALAAEFFGLTEEERHYFLLLLHHARAGSRPLRQYYEKQMAAAQEARKRVTERLKVANPLAPEVQARYYSAWYYAALHVLLSVKGMDTVGALAQALGLSVALTADALEFLVAAGIARRTGGKFEIGPTRLHLPDTSPWVARHHANWRLKAMQAMERPLGSHPLHYSAVYTLSERDVPRVRGLLLEAIERAEPILRESPAEKTYCLAADFFGVTP